MKYEKFHSWAEAQPAFQAAKEKARLEQARTDAEARKYPNYKFYFCGKIGHTDWRHSILGLK